MDLPPIGGISYEPSPRFKQVKCATSDGKIFMWGGQTSECYTDDGRTRVTSGIQRFDPYKEVWSTPLTTEGTPHPGFSDPAFCSFGDNLFMYGGISDTAVPISSDCVSGVLSCLNTKTLTWSVLSCGETDSGQPMKKTGCRLVHFGLDKLALIGGYGFPTGPTQPGSSFKGNFRFDDGRGYSNEFHVLDMSQGTWISPIVKGTRPPPCSGFTLTSIDSHRAILYGGNQPERGEVSDLYLIDFNTMEFTKVEQCEGEPWPVGRMSHAACCLGYGGDHIQLLVIGGLSGDNKTLKDVWLFDVSSRKWKEVRLPSDTQPRRGHSATAVTVCSGLVDIIIFGGINEDHDSFKTKKDYSRIAETSIITFGLLGSEWVLMGVANNNQRGTSERVREKMILRSEPGAQEPGPFDLEGLINTYALYRLERVGIQVKSEMSKKIQNIQAIILREKQPDINLMMIHWINNVQKSIIKPTWRNLFILLQLISLDDLAEKITSFFIGAPMEGDTVEKKTKEDTHFDPDETEFSMTSLIQLERLSGIPILASLQDKSRDFQAVIRVQQHSITGAIEKWVTAPKGVLSRIVPTWKNLFLVLRLIDLDQLALQMEIFLKEHPSLDKIEGEELESLKQRLSFQEKVISQLKLENQCLKRERLSTQRVKSAPTSPIRQVPSPKPPDWLPLIAAEVQFESEYVMTRGMVKEEPFVEAQMTHGQLQVTTTETRESERNVYLAADTETTRALVTGPVAGLRGANVWRETTVVVTNNPLDCTDWEDYGLKLHIPKGCLPIGMEQCTINIKASLAGQYEFPENIHPVSAVFWLRCEPKCTFTKALTLEINHCAKSENASKLCFVRAVCTQPHLPYTFRRLDGGKFSRFSSYGAIELNCFSGVAVCQEGSEEREYSARLYYLPKSLSFEFDIHFVITWNTKIHLAVVKEEYSQPRALPGHFQPVDFQAEEITLDIPMEGLTCKEWMISPLFAPVVCKKNVDRFEPGKMIPCCQFCAEFSGTSISPFKHIVKLEGAKKPYDSFLIKPPAAIFNKTSVILEGGTGSQVSGGEASSSLPVSANISLPGQKRGAYDSNVQSAFHSNIKRQKINHSLLPAGSNNYREQAGNEALIQGLDSATLSGGASTSSLLAGSGPGLDTKLELDLHHFEVVNYLHDLNRQQICDLGGALGLAYSNLEKMSTFPQEMVAAWLRREDNVISKSGEPTWRSLVQALKKVGQGGVASTIKTEHCATVS